MINIFVAFETMAHNFQHQFTFLWTLFWKNSEKKMSFWVPLCMHCIKISSFNNIHRVASFYKISQHQRCFLVVACFIGRKKTQWLKMYTEWSSKRLLGFFEYFNNISFVFYFFFFIWKMNGRSHGLYKFMSANANKIIILYSEIILNIFNIRQ